MTTRNDQQMSAQTQATAAAWNRLFFLGGLALLLSALSSMLGGVWDIQWHEDVGPDTFLTAPHQLLYAGAAGAGLTSLIVTMIATWRVRQGSPRDPALAPWLGGVFWAPYGVVIAGCGALLYLAFGLFDLWWHTIYGFDAVLDSPPHTGLGLADLVTLAGVVVVAALLASRSDLTPRQRAWSAIGLATAVAIFLINSASWQIGFAGELVGPIDGQWLFIAVCYPAALLLTASVVRRTGAIVLTGGIFTLLCLAAWGFSAWATPLYATSLGLLPRETAFGYPRIVAVLPLGVLPAAALMEAVLAAVRRRAGSVRLGVMLAAGVGAPVLIAGEALAARGVFIVPGLGWSLVTAALVALIAALSGWAGWQLGVVLRCLAGGGAFREAPAPSAAVGRVAGALMAIVSLAAGGWLGMPRDAEAHPGGPVVEVHREQVEVGPYSIDIGFSDWPPRAERSLDIIVHTAGGIAGKQGTIALKAPSGAVQTFPLVRHPRQPEDWGLDIIALPEEGDWRIVLAIDGPLGPGAGEVTIALGPRPGPPELVGWLPPLAVVLAMIATLTAAWRLVRPTHLPQTHTWQWG